MEASSKPWFVIINPTSANGSANKKWQKIKSLLNQYDFDYTYKFTEYSNHASELVQEAISKDILNIICIGGDGTLHNVVNGVMSQKFTSSNTVNIGVIPIGTGNDWVRTYNIPKNIETAIQIIKNGIVKQQDIGQVEVENTTTYFNNLLGVGFDGHVVKNSSNIKHFGALAYVVGTIKTLFLFKNFNSKTTINSEIIEGKSLMILIGLYKYAGGGMLLTENPNTEDGLFDISVAGDYNKLTVLRHTTKMFRGTVVKLEDYKTFKSDTITVTILDEDKPFIQADGELLGTGNLTVSIIPKAFSFYASN
jgi:YegS/Rv2252/BmrU family lipid kinase